MSAIWGSGSTDPALVVPPAEEPLTPEELVRLPFVLTERGESYRQDFDRALAEHNLGVTPIIETRSTEMLLRLALGGAVVGWVLGMVDYAEISRAARSLRFRRRSPCPLWPFRCSIASRNGSRPP